VLPEEIKESEYKNIPTINWHADILKTFDLALILTDIAFRYTPCHQRR
jgi:hypothetical protein